MSERASRRRPRRDAERFAISARPALLLAVALWLSGCQTFRSFEQGCPGIYSGTRYYGDQLRDIPFDGKVFFTLDLPLTLVADTLALPGTAFADPAEPTGGFPLGCRWAGGAPR